MRSIPLWPKAPIINNNLQENNDPVLDLRDARRAYDPLLYAHFLPQCIGIQAKPMTAVKQMPTAHHFQMFIKI